MTLPKKYDFNDYDNYLTDPNPTTSAEAQDYFRNMDMLVTAMVDAFLWQPKTNYANGDVVKSPSMPNGAEAVCVAENGGKSSNVEPQWGNVGGENIADGTCFWKLRVTGTVTRVNGIKPNANGEVDIPAMTGSTSTVNGAEGLVPAPAKGSEQFPLLGSGEFKNILGLRTPNTTYILNAVVACPYHAEYLLKCTQAGTTSANTLDTTNATKGRVITDGDVKWEVISFLEMFLPLVGGILTGTIIIDNSGNPALCPSTDSSLLRLYGGYGYASHGANLDLYGEKEASNAGGFILRARTQEKIVALQGGINGSLTWGGKPVYTPDAVQFIFNTSYTFTLPSGGTWKYFVLASTNLGDYTLTLSGTAAGGTTITHTDKNVTRSHGLAFRVS